MQEAETRRDRRRPPRRRVTVAGVIGELLVTAGVLVLLFVAWQLWIGDIIIGAQFKDEARSITQEWATQQPTEPASPAPSSSAAPSTTAPVTADPPALPQPGNGQVFGVIHIPRFGPDYQFRVAGGVSSSVTLDPIGIGHYPGTAMPGQQGNFALAGHRGSHGAPFADLPALHVGDAIVIETQDGWYTYRFRNLEYVRPQQTEVLLPLPQTPGGDDSGRLLTMTTCSPRYGFSERAIAYGVFESYTPRSAGPPASLTLGAA